MRYRHVAPPGGCFLVAPRAREEVDAEHRAVGQVHRVDDGAESPVIRPHGSSAASAARRAPDAKSRPQHERPQRVKPVPGWDARNSRACSGNQCVDSRPAASSMASGMPSRRRTMSPIKRRSSGPGEKSGWTRAGVVDEHGHRRGTGDVVEVAGVRRRQGCEAHLLFGGVSERFSAGGHERRGPSRLAHTGGRLRRRGGVRHRAGTDRRPPPLGRHLRGRHRRTRSRHRHGRAVAPPPMANNDPRSSWPNGPVTVICVAVDDSRLTELTTSVRQAAHRRLLDGPTPRHRSRIGSPGWVPADRQLINRDDRPTGPSCMPSTRPHHRRAADRADLREPTHSTVWGEVGMVAPAR